MEQWLSWELNGSFLTVLLLSVLSALWVSYVVCWIKLRRNGNHAASVGRLVSWFSGLLIIAIATMSAIDAMSDRLFSIHMVQHMLLIYLAPPLLLLGRPLSISQAFTRNHAPKTDDTLPSQNPIVRGFGLIMKPHVAWGLSTIMLLLWHVPWFYDYALAHDIVHELGEHLSLFLTFMLWWQPLIGTVSPFPYLDTARGRLLYLVAGLIPMMLLGILVLFWPDVLYTYYLSVPRIYGITAMLDQHLGGGIMMFGGWMVLLIVGLPLQYWDTRERSHNTEIPRY